MKLSKHYKYNLPEYTDVADIIRITENFEKIDDDLFTTNETLKNTNISVSNLDEAMKTFDYLANKYGYTYVETESSNIVTHTETLGQNAPISGSRITKEMEDGGNDIFLITITVGEKIISHRVTVGETTAEMVVS